MEEVVVEQDKNVMRLLVVLVTRMLQMHYKVLLEEQVKQKVVVASRSIQREP